MVNQQTPFTFNGSLDRSKLQSIPTPDYTKLTSKQIFMWISKPGDGGNITKYTDLQDFIKKYFNSFGTVADPTVLSANALDLEMVAGNVDLIKGREVLVRSVGFQNFSVRSTDVVTQDIIDASLSRVNSADVQAMFDRSPMASWMDNFFRPTFIFGGSDLYSGLGVLKPNAQTPNSLLTAIHKSIGFPLPFFDTPNAHGMFGSGSFDVKAGCFQPIKQSDGTYKFQQYPVQCFAEILF